MTAPPGEVEEGKEDGEERRGGEERGILGQASTAAPCDAQRSIILLPVASVRAPRGTAAIET